uniref:Ras-GEF domain-containing protein n=1 Tax=Globodera pallida TaxID=36090 RepID=A0A183BMA7_GLOPA
MQLIFSYAARILLCLTDDDYYSSNGIGEWQLQTLLSAYKILAERYDNNENGIFPFPIVQIDAKGTHLWAEFINQNISKKSSERKQFIENFNFVLKLSKFSLSYYDVYKVLEAILRESNAVPSSTINNNNHLPPNDEPPQPPVHTFLKQYFIAKLGTKSMKLKQYMLSKFGSSKVNKVVVCAFVHFGRELERRLKEHNSCIRYPGFSQYVQQMEKECGKAPHIKHNYWETPTENTPSRMSKQLEMELFHEPLWNYARAIQVDSHTCKD